jgi:GMP synthase (glutamine-hydrolysing)
MNELILVLDFGGQYKELIARNIRACNVYSAVKSGSISVKEIRELNPIGIVLTGGPNSVYAEDAALCDKRIFSLGIPVLGICYGMQLMCHSLGGSVAPCKKSEYGTIRAAFDSKSELFKGGADKGGVLMSHTDCVIKLPEGFKNTARTANCKNAACELSEKKLFGVQFHPETEQTEQGMLIIKNFLFNVCGAHADYRLDDYLERQIRSVRERVGDQRVLLALSGGVDSSVCASLLSEAIPGRLTCVFVDHGFMRHDEGDQIEAVFSKKNLQFIRVNAKDRFLARLKGVTSPEKKRKIIGQEFIRVFEDEAAKLGDIRFLAQGTIYPDIIESGKGKRSTIKSHHNVGGLPKNMSFAEVIEPLSGLFKDEVRQIGKKLGLPDSIIQRQPFPGPGLSVRIMGEVTEEKLAILRHADFIFCEEIQKCAARPQQYFAAFTNIRTVGVKGDRRTYDYVIALRAVNTNDFMTCDYSKIPHKILGLAAARIVNEVESVGRVVFDITNKPPATIEWE